MKRFYEWILLLLVVFALSASVYQVAVGDIACGWVMFALGVSCFSNYLSEKRAEENLKIAEEEHEKVIRLRKENKSLWDVFENM